MSLSAIRGETWEIVPAGINLLVGLLVGLLPHRLAGLQVDRLVQVGAVLIVGICPILKENALYH